MVKLIMIIASVFTTLNANAEEAFSHLIIITFSDIHCEIKIESVRKMKLPFERISLSTDLIGAISSEYLAIKQLVNESDISGQLCTS
ncbi:MAG: hypothetical protein H7061_10410 [Bdellovibrionaceae bacterium]|nr:hypothetical protein [Bdellovibrio sp.]